MTLREIVSLAQGPFAVGTVASALEPVSVWLDTVVFACSLRFSGDFHGWVQVEKS